MDPALPLPTFPAPQTVNFRHFQERRRRPVYKKSHCTPSDYLKTARLRLLDKLPKDHRLYSRTTYAGTLRPEHLPDPPRPAFTDGELEAIKARRRKASGANDPDNVRYQLQESKLVEMWNADCEREQQWREYSESRTTIHVKKNAARLPDEVSDEDSAVGEKRKRVVSTEYKALGRQKLAHSHIDEEDEEDDSSMQGEVGDDLEEGEINWERDLDEGEVAERSLQTLQKVNERILAANTRMRSIVEGLTTDIEDDEASSLLTHSETPSASALSPALLVSPTRSEAKSESSECESDDSTRAVCRRWKDDLRYTTLHKGTPQRIDSWLDEMDKDRKMEDNTPAPRRKESMYFDKDRM